MTIIDDLKKRVEKYFQVYDVRWDYDSIAYFCNVEEETLEEDFEDLRLELKEDSYIPMLIHEGGEHIVFVTKKADVEYKGINVNIIMFLLTICTTVFVGALNWASYDPTIHGDEDWTRMFSPRCVGMGALFFALPLMTILGIHELGHFYMAKHHKVAASWPFFIPVPFPPLGTFGAFISMREPIPNKKALMDIGAAGPIAGFCVAVPVTLIGIWLTNVFAVKVPTDASGLVYMGSSVVFTGLTSLVQTGPYLMHPTALAGWVGLLVTFLNLLPAGQLDGGHVMRALFGERAKYVSYGVIFMMLMFAVDVPTFQNPYLGWFLFVFIILFLGVAHPPPLNDVSPLDTKRFAIGAVCLMILAGCFVKVPLEQAPPHYGMVLTTDDGFINVLPNESLNVTFNVYNNGNVGDRYRYDLLDAKVVNTAGWNVSFSNKSRDDWDGKTKEMKPTHDRNVTIFVNVPVNASMGDERYFTVKAKSVGDGKRTAVISMEVVVGRATITTQKPYIRAIPGESTYLDINVRALAPGNRTANLSIEAPNGLTFISGQYGFVFSNLTGQKEQDVRLMVTTLADIDVTGMFNVTLRLEVDGNESWTEVKMLPVVFPGPYSILVELGGTGAGGSGGIGGPAGAIVEVPMSVRGLSSSSTVVDLVMNASTGVTVTPTNVSVQLEARGNTTVKVSITLPATTGQRGWVEIVATPREAPSQAERLLVDVKAT